MTISGLVVKSHVENSPGLLTRAERQQAGICVRRSCADLADEESDYCAQHAEAQRRYQADYMARRRAGWVAAGQCGECGRDRKRGSRLCPRCLARRGKSSRQVVKSHVENKRDRITARLIPWKDSPTNANRVRLRGGDRGRRPVADIDAEDLAEAVKLLETGRKELAVYHRDAEQLPRVQRAEWRAAALSWVERAERWLAEVLVRNGARQAKAEDPEDG